MRTGSFSSARLVFWLRLGLTAATVAILWRYLLRRPDFRFLGDSPQWENLVLALALLPPLVWLRATKWRVLLRPLDASITFGQSLRSYLGALPLGLLTPGRAGEFARGLYLPQPRLRSVEAAGQVLVDGFTDFQVVLLWSLPGLWFLWDLAGLALGAALCLFCWPLRFWLRLARGAVSRFPRLWGVSALVQRVLPEGAATEPAAVNPARLWALCAYGVEWLQYFWLVRFLAPDTDGFWALTGCMALVTLLNSFQVTLAGLGIREGLAALILARLGLSPELAAATAFLHFVLIQALPALAGLALKPVVLPPAPPGPAAAVPGGPAGPAHSGQSHS